MSFRELFTSTEDRLPLAAPRAHADVEPQEPTLQDLTLLKVALSWQEAVAVVLETLHRLPPDAACPDPARVTISAIGETAVLPGAPLPGPAVPAAAGLLRTLVASANPPGELRALLDRDADGTPEHTTLGGFTAALAYFERPNRRGDVAAVHARAHAVYLKSVADQELERLRAKAVRVAPAPQQQPSLLARLRPIMSQTALIVVLLAAILASIYQLVSMAMPQPAESADEVAAAPATTSVIQSAGMQVKQIVAAALSFAGVRISAAPSLTDAATKGRATAERTRSADRNAGALSSAVDAALSRPGAGPSNVEWTVSVRDVTAAYTSNGASEPLPSEKFDDSLPVFSALDGDVDPAMLIRPQLPSRASAIDDPDVSALDLIVDERGQVERVRLDATRSRLNEKMLVSAAKAWIFQPALRFGHPVRYRLRVQITE